MKCVNVRVQNICIPEFFRGLSTGGQRYHCFGNVLRKLVRDRSRSARDLKGTSHPYRRCPARYGKYLIRCGRRVWYREECCGKDRVKGPSVSVINQVSFIEYDCLLLPPKRIELPHLFDIRPYNPVFRGLRGRCSEHFYITKVHDPQSVELSSFRGHCEVHCDSIEFACRRYIVTCFCQPEGDGNREGRVAPTNGWP